MVKTVGDVVGDAVYDGLLDAYYYEGNEAHVEEITDSIIKEVTNVLGIRYSNMSEKQIKAIENATQNAVLTSYEDGYNHLIQETDLSDLAENVIKDIKKNLPLQFRNRMDQELHLRDPEEALAL